VKLFTVPLSPFSSTLPIPNNLIPFAMLM
jgi:hypothetical protein